jgi:hypothetical protein
MQKGAPVAVCRWWEKGICSGIVLAYPPPGNWLCRLIQRLCIKWTPACRLATNMEDQYMPMGTPALVCKLCNLHLSIL